MAARSKKIDVYDEPLDNTAGITALYEEFGKDLVIVREQQAKLYKMLTWPMFDDVEAEILYMLVRKHQPVSVIEVSSGCGWSSSWILSALRDNHLGRLTSCDFTDYAKQHIPLEIHDNRWDYHAGDVRAIANKFPKRADFIFEDSAHDEDFNKWFADEFYGRLNPKGVLCVHDVFMLLHPRHSDATVLFDWAKRQNVRFWTPAKAMEKQWEAISKLRLSLGITNDIHSLCDRNPLAVVER